MNSLMTRTSEYQLEITLKLKNESVKSMLIKFTTLRFIMRVWQIYRIEINYNPTVCKVSELYFLPNFACKVERLLLCRTL